MAGMVETRERRRFRFSLKLLLVLMTLIAVYLVGRWNGYQKARQDALNYPFHPPLSGASPSASDAVTLCLSGLTDKPPK
jgi:hypothetical protein